MFSRVRNLRDLTLVTNKITEVKNKTFLHLTELQLLNLNNNRIRSLTGDCFQDLSNLEELYLKQNKISVIHSNVFREMKKLRILNLSSNQLRSVSDKTFDGLSRLEILILSQNRIKHFTSAVCQQLKSVQILDIRGNPIKRTSTTRNQSQLCDEKNSKTEEIPDHHYLTDGEFFTSIIILFTIVAIIAIVSVLVMFYMRKRRDSVRSIFVLYEEEDEDVGWALARQLQLMLPEIPVLSCRDCKPGQIKVRD